MPVLKSPEFPLACPVRGCSLPLSYRNRMLECASGHAFNISRNGTCTLLQPQDRRSAQPGDAPSAVEARRRWLERGRADGLIRALGSLIDDLDLPRSASVVDLGCGEGSLTAQLARGRDWNVCGIDLSERALALAAKCMPTATWLRANADRRLPFLDESIDLALSLFGRRPAEEVHRVLKPRGRFLVAIPGPDDLIELREAVLGEGARLAGEAKLERDLAPWFDLGETREWREHAQLDREEVADALAMTYRGSRHSQAAKTERLGPVAVTLSATLAVLLPRTGAKEGGPSGPVLS